MPVVVVTSAICKNPHVTVVFYLLSICDDVFVYLYVLTFPLICTLFTLSACGVVVFPCVWMLCLCSVLTPVFVMHRGGGEGEGGEGGYVVLSCVNFV
jgi:hypothetical protein